MPTDQEFSDLLNEVRRLRAEKEKHERDILDLYALVKQATKGTGIYGQTPAEIGDDAEPPEAGYTDEWDRDADFVPVDVWVSTGEAYYDASDETLYGYKARMRYDANGLLYAVDSHTVYEIDVPEAC